MFKRSWANQTTTSFCLAAAVLCYGGIVAAQTAPALQAVVSYETRQVTKAGITRVETWQENMLRQGDTLWTERILPREAGQTAHAGHNHDVKPKASHKHLDIDTAARWLQKDAAGAVVLRYVDKADKVVVSIPKAEFGTVGFDGRWDTAAYLVPPDLVAKMKPAGTGPNGGVWRTEQAQDWTHRALWSESKQIALQVESKKTDGSFSRTIRVTIKADPDATLPWAKLAGYEQKKYDDYMD
jgi:hypothetical protein